MSPAVLAGWLRGFVEGISDEGPTPDQLRRLVEVASTSMPAAELAEALVTPAPSAATATAKKLGRPPRADLLGAPAGVELPKVERFG